MPKNCPLNKLDTHACWECIYNFGDSCTYEVQDVIESASEKVKLQVASCDCIDCFHFNVCSRLMGGMDLEKCADYVFSSNVHIIGDDIK